MTAIRCFLGSWIGILATVSVATAGAYLIWAHSGHVLAVAPYLLLLICPLMHLFGHRHGGQDHTKEHVHD
jgi:hypothetical protein